MLEQHQIPGSPGLAFCLAGAIPSSLVDVWWWTISQFAYHFIHKAIAYFQRLLTSYMTEELGLLHDVFASWLQLRTSLFLLASRRPTAMLCRHAHSQCAGRSSIKSGFSQLRRTSHMTIANQVATIRRLQWPAKFVSTQPTQLYSHNMYQSCNRYQHLLTNANRTQRCCRTQNGVELTKQNSQTNRDKH